MRALCCLSIGYSSDFKLSALVLYCSSMRIIVADFCVFFATILGIQLASFVVLVSFMLIVILLVRCSDDDGCSDCSDALMMAIGRN